MRKLRAGLMPPAGRRRPDEASRDALVRWLETELDRVAATRPNPGRTEPLHRLNRAEYRNAIRDLLALDVDVTALLPADDASYGFDNIAGALKISQARLEQYLLAAKKISRAAVGSPLPAPVAEEFRVPETLQQYEHIDGLPFGTRGGLPVSFHFPQDGEYEIGVELRCRVFGECDGSVGFGEEHILEVLLDGHSIGSYRLEPRMEFGPPEERQRLIRLPVKAGPHRVGATFRKLPSIEETDSPLQRFQKPFYVTGFVGLPHYTIYQPFVDRITITGPLGSSAGPGDTPSRRRIFTCRPASLADETRCARANLSALGRRAYRRPVNDRDLDVLMHFYEEGRSAGTFQMGIDTALRRLLVSPEFLFRIERDPPGAAPGEPYRISDLELASRLSFFLWSSIPDDELLQAAERGQLKDPAMLERQVRRMIADPRADRLVENFAGQWLLLRNLDAVSPDVPLFPNFDDTLRQAFRKETELFFASILREERGVIELLTADYTFVNERLARHYGIAGIYGDQFRRVKLTESNRRGILGHGSILTVTSRPNRTSPVLRGKWILENILGTPPPEPPADVPALREDGIGNHSKVESVRERLVRHRANPVCAGCHSMIDPPGFALQNFDAVGRWRAVDERFRTIDASGVLPDGTKFDGLNSFRTYLTKDPSRFATTVMEKLMTYALGRGVEVYDMPAIRQIRREAEPDGLKLSALIVGIAKSVPFQMRQAGSATAVAAASSNSRSNVVER